MKRKNKTTKYILAGLFLSSMMGVTTACDPLGIEPTTKVDEERFWENPQLARSYVNNFYFISQSASGDTFQSEQWSDNCQGNYEQDWDTYRQKLRRTNSWVNVTFSVLLFILTWKSFGEAFLM